MSRPRVRKDTAQVADSFKRLYEELPKEMHGGSDAKVEVSLRKFLQDNLPQTERNEIDGELKKTTRFDPHQRLGKRRRGSVNRKGRKGQYLTSKERRKLCLNRLPPGAKLCASDFKELNKLWLDYMRKLIGNVNIVDGVPPPPEANVIRTVGDDQLQMRVARADFHGALVKVSSSKNATLSGVEGYVAMETRNTLQIVTRRNEVKMIPKKDSAFSFRVDDLIFTVGGANMCAKPSERGVKKWKTKPSFDL